MSPKADPQNEFSVTCPHCGFGVYPKLVATFTEANYKHHYIAQCSGRCNHIFFVTRDQDFAASVHNQSGEDVFNSHVYPQNLLQPHRLNETIPYGIRQDFAEAANCRSIEAYKACVTMCRRTIQNCMRDKGAKKDKLLDQIDEIVKDQQIKDIAHSTRIIGNWGAHEQEDDLKKVDWKIAKAILDFTWRILQDLYILPKQLNEIKGTISGRKKKSE